jgi:hypothetical protein
MSDDEAEAGVINAAPTGEAKPALTTADDLLAAFAQEPERTFEVALKGGLSVTFRAPADAVEFYRLGKLAARFAKLIAGGAAPAEMRPWLPVPVDIATMAYWVSALAVDPTFSQVQALKLAKTCGPLLNYLYGEILTDVGKAVADGEAEAIDQAGEGCAPTATGATT